MPDRWSRQLFMALCRRYSLSPYRYARQRYTTLMLRVPEAFVDDVLWPHYQALNKELKAYLEEATEKIISEEIHRDTTEAQEVVQLLETG
jgi:tRNA nucleotidyltransferase (CCA-adding enzyme)